MKTLVIFGAGGHGVVCADIAEETGHFAAIGFSDEERLNELVDERWQVKFRDEDFPLLDSGKYCFILGVGQVSVGNARHKLFEKIKASGLEPAAVVSPDAYVARSASVGAGTLIGRMAVVQPGASIGENTIINSRAIVEHDARVGRDVHVSTGAILNGGVVIGDRCLIGSGATLLHGVEICQDVIVGAGAVVTKDISEPGTYVGVPARRRQER